MMLHMCNDGGASRRHPGETAALLDPHRTVMGPVHGGPSSPDSLASVVSTGLERIKREVPSNSNFCWLFVVKYHRGRLSSWLLPAG